MQRLYMQCSGMLLQSADYPMLHNSFEVHVEEEFRSPPAVIGSMR